MKTFFILAFVLLSSSFAQKVKVDIYFESLCPDSIKFINQQLYPIWPRIAPYVNVNFIPFGKSVSLEDKQNFICQHGPDECVGNKVMSCALNNIPNQDAQVEFVNCFMATYKSGHKLGDFGQSCAAGLGLDWLVVSSCFESQQGTDLQLYAEQATALIRPAFVPTIVYNKQFNQLAQDESQHNFQGIVCSYIKKLYPQGC